MRRRIPTAAVAPRQGNTICFFVFFKLSGGEKKSLFQKDKRKKTKTAVPLSFRRHCIFRAALFARPQWPSGKKRPRKRFGSERNLWRDSVVSGPSFLHAGSFGFGDVLVVGLVFQLSAEVLDGFVQALLQRHLSRHSIVKSGACTEK